MSINYHLLLGPCEKGQLTSKQRFSSLWHTQTSSKHSERTMNNDSMWSFPLPYKKDKIICSKHDYFAYQVPNKFIHDGPTSSSVTTMPLNPPSKANIYKEPEYNEDTHPDFQITQEPSSHLKKMAFIFKTPPHTESQSLECLLWSPAEEYNRGRKKTHHILNS